MFDLNASDGSVRKKTYKSPIPDGPAPKPVPASQLASARMLDLHKRLLDLYTRELDRQYENRIEQAIDEDFYDSIQWREEDAKVVRERGQVPLVYNVIATTVDWVLGTEKRTRTDAKVLPRRKTEAKPAQRKSELMKYLSDVNREPFQISRSFADAVKSGLGWIEDGIRDDDDDEPLYSRYENWRNMLWDSAATELDLSDARYIFRTKWVDLDIACGMFKQHKGLLEQSAADADDFIALDQFGDEAMDAQELALEQQGHSVTSDRVSGYQRRRVRLIEGWLRMPEDTARLKGGAFSGEIFDFSSPAHRESVQGGEAKIVVKMAMRMHVAIFTSVGMLWFSPSPFRHNKFPFTPVWGGRRGRDGMPYGMIRRLKDIQEDINKRASKALHILSTNKTIMEEGAVDDLDEFLDEVSRPDAVIVKKAGKELTINADRDLSQWHLELMSRSIAMLQQAGGVTDENMGRRTNATSGIAIQRRQDQGAMATAHFFDNLLLAKQVHGEKQLANIEQFMTERKAFRITNMRGTPEYVEINDGLPANDITRSKADYIISEAAWQASMRQAAAAELLDLLGKLAPAAPQLVMVVLDLILESMDLPNGEEIVKRIRAITNMRDPDQDEPSPEEIERAQQAAQDAKLQRAQVEADIRKKLAESMRAEAAARQLVARIVGDNVDAQQKALAAAREAIALPASTHVADHILHESGFVSRSDQQAVEQATQQNAPGVMPAPDTAQEAIGLGQPMQ